MFLSHKEGFGWVELITAILFFNAAYFAFSHPIDTLVTITIFFGIVALLRGIFSLVTYFRVRNGGTSESSPAILLVFGIVGILVGLAFLFFSVLGTVVLSYAFAVWFFVDSVEGVSQASRYKRRGTGFYWTAIVLNVIGLIVGVLLLLNPLTALFTLSYLIGLAFVYFGVLNVFLAFA